MALAALFAQRRCLDQGAREAPGKAGLVPNSCGAGGLFAYINTCIIYNTVIYLFIYLLMNIFIYEFIYLYLFIYLFERTPYRDIFELLSTVGKFPRF